MEEDLKIKEPTEEEIRGQSIRIAVSRADFMTGFPKFYRAFDYVDQFPDSRIPTMGVRPLYDKDTQELTGRHDFIWSPKFAATLTDKQLLGVQMHELLHILLQHTTTRAPYRGKIKINKGGDAQLEEKEDQMHALIWNIATDLSINCMIKSYLQDPKGPKVGLFPGQGEYAALPEYRSAEFYYEQLLKEYEQEKKEMQKLINKLKEILKKAQGGDHGDWVEADDKGKVQKGNGQGGIKVQGNGPKGDQESPTADDIAKEMEKIANDLGCGGIKAGCGTNATSKYTDLSAGKEKRTPGWMKKATHASAHGFEVSPVATRKVPNRRFGILFPGRRRVSHRNKCLIAVDVSGSIDRPLLDKFTHHLNNLKKHADFDMFLFNSGIINKNGQNFTPETAEKAVFQWKTGMDIYIGGGTDFEPIMLFWNRVHRKYDSLFIFTDGEAGYRTPPTKPREVNWILYAQSDWYKDAIKHGNKYDIKNKEE